MVLVRLECSVFGFQGASLVVSNAQSVANDAKKKDLLRKTYFPR